MKNLFDAHYEAIKLRGKINCDTTSIDFIEKMNEEFTLVRESLVNVGIEKHKQEVIDLMMVCANYIKFLGGDVEDELIKNLEYQLNRRG